ncbi:MAG: EAL domain-containing protein [Pseudomonadota bacterium]
MRQFVSKLIGKFTLRRELSVTITLGVVLLALAISVVASWQVNQRVRADLLAQGERITESLAHQSVLALLYQSPENVEVAAKATMAFPGVVGVQVRNLDQTVLLQDVASVHRDFLNQSPNGSFGEMAVAAENNAAWMFVAPAYTKPSNDGSSPFNLEAGKPELVGSVRVVLSKEILAATSREIFVSNVTTAAVFAVLFLLLIRFLTHRITVPLQRLEAKMGLAQSGQTGVRIAPSGPKDIVEMADAFNQMMAGLEARDADLRIAAVAFESDEGMVVTDARGKVMRVNQAFTDLTGYSAEEVMGKWPTMLKSDIQNEDFYRGVWRSIQQDDYWQGELWTQHKNGESRLELLTVSKIVSADGRVTNFFAAFIDMTARNRAEREIHNLAFYDQLSKLPNRRLLFDRMQQAVARGSISENRCALLFLDLDNFKTLNDTKGHALGDMLLMEVAKRLQSCVRECDTVARFGGDEFVVLLEGLSELDETAVQQARSVGEKLLELTNQPYYLDGHTHHGSSSVGITTFIGQQQNPNDLLKQADMAMYAAKKNGRNRLCFFDPGMQHELELRAQREIDLRNALARKEFRLHYQQQVNRQGRIIGAEILLRWQHGKDGMVLPSDFIPLAEETNLILPIGEWVLETAMQQLYEWARDPLLKHIDLAINVSALQFRQANFVEHIQELLLQYEVNPLRLKLELTESIMLDDVSDTVDKMQALRKGGIRFSMDDFGTGYSSLSYLTKLPLDQLKIDQSFVRNMEETHTDAAIVQTIVLMAKSLGMEVIAEGVETRQNRDFLAQTGCMLYQGYLFGMPLPVEEFVALVKRQAADEQAESSGSNLMYEI